MLNLCFWPCFVKWRHVFDHGQISPEILAKLEGNIRHSPTSRQCHKGALGPRTSCDGLHLPHWQGFVNMSIPRPPPMTHFNQGDITLMTQPSRRSPQINTTIKDIFHRDTQLPALRGQGQTYIACSLRHLRNITDHRHYA